MDGRSRLPEPATTEGRWAALLGRFDDALIVSCQPSTENPLSGPAFAAAIARAAEIGGARAVRADGPDDVAAVRRAVRIPVVAIRTVVTDGFPVSITPDLASARALTDAGADLIAIDGTARARAGGASVVELIARIHELGVPVEADVDSVEDAIAAAALGADLIGTSITGYAGGVPRREPDIELVRRLAITVDRPVVAQRHYATIEHVRAAFEAGARAVVVGSAIADPVYLTRRFVEGIAGGARG
jgi:N-acylglucosamine-6-phosphate 2-epimerase